MQVEGRFLPHSDSGIHVDGDSDILNIRLPRLLWIYTCTMQKRKQHGGSPVGHFSRADLGVNVSPLFIFLWLELSHMMTSKCKGGWEM